MICPHCKRAFTRGVTPKVEKRIRHHARSGASCRDIEKFLYREGLVVSYSTIFRTVRKLKAA
jgi:transposase-like protein